MAEETYLCASVIVIVGKSELSYCRQIRTRLLCVSLVVLHQPISINSLLLNHNRICTKECLCWRGCACEWQILWKHTNEKVLYVLCLFFPQLVDSWCALFVWNAYESTVNIVTLDFVYFWKHECLVISFLLCTRFVHTCTVC